ncbi:MAG: hypothetical protein VB104_07010 [Candidatus Limiplasma sp.]|nr:hypothetical protein [Candidatus Limiplasma sp.]
MQTYLTPKDVADRLHVNIGTARAEMRKMRHKGLGKNGQILRVSEADFDAYMRPDPPLPRPESRKKRTTETRSDRTIPYRPYRTQEATENV